MNPLEQQAADHVAWLAEKKMALYAINGLDPVEELLTQAGVRQHSHDLLVEQRDAAHRRISELEQENAALKGQLGRDDNLRVMALRDEIVGLTLRLEAERDRNLNEIQAMIEDDPFLSMIVLKDLHFLLGVARTYGYQVLGPHWVGIVDRYQEKLKTRIGKLEAQLK